MDILNTEPTRVEGNRSVQFEWVLQTTPTASQVATLNVSHSDKRLTAALTRVWREERRPGRFSTSFEIGGPGFRLPSEPAPRFSQKRLDAFALDALAALVENADHEQVVAVMTPSDRSCGCGSGHESNCPVRIAEVAAERAQRETRNLERAAARPEAHRADQPDWLYCRVNDSYGTDNRHPFWTTVEVVKIGAWKLFVKDGAWFGYDTQHNAWAQFKSEEEARTMAAGPSMDVWA